LKAPEKNPAISRPLKKMLPQKKRKTEIRTLTHSMVYEVAPLSEAVSYSFPVIAGDLGLDPGGVAISLISIVYRLSLVREIEAKRLRSLHALAMTLRNSLSAKKSA
jgi:hypothetical protein